MYVLTTLTDELVTIFILAFLGLALATLITPIYTTLAYRYKFWKKPRDNAFTGEKAKVFTRLHAAKHKRHIPTMAGVIALMAVAIVTIGFNWSRQQTWLPLAAMVGAGLVGLLDDIINIRGLKPGIAGLRSSFKFLLITLVAVVGGWYFYSKLGYDSIQLTFDSQLVLGWALIPIFAFVVVATANAVNISDGLDGLAGGLLVSAFSAFGTIAFLQGNYGLAGFCLTVVGTLISYVWFNIFPARFFMGDVGSFALGTALGVVAMLTDTLLLLPIIGGVFVLEAGSSLLQILSKRLRGKKIFLSAPIHHHFEASGWPETKVTMRFWLVSQVLAVSGIVLAIIGGHV
ncbi:MAG TPA: phospho-N-acetylmuramoyl-pentapeptide-transferase [Candidatus Saccharimonadales bacterium]